MFNRAVERLKHAPFMCIQMKFTVNLLFTVVNVRWQEYFATHKIVLFMTLGTIE